MEKELWTLKELNERFGLSLDIAKDWLDRLYINKVSNNDNGAAVYSIHPILIQCLATVADFSDDTELAMDVVIALTNRLKHFAVAFQKKEDDIRALVTHVEIWETIAREYARRISTVSVEPYCEAMTAELDYMQQRFRSLQEWHALNNGPTPPRLIVKKELPYDL